MSVRNRGSQYGPIGGMGQRANAENLDLNRDNTKLETAEARSLARLLTAVRPAHRDRPAHDQRQRPRLLSHLRDLGEPEHSPGDREPRPRRPAARRHQSREGEARLELLLLRRADPVAASACGPATLDLYKPRYTQTYFGVRNRIGILSETYSYAIFEDRIKSNYWFLEEIINYAVTNSDAIRKATAAADAESIIGTPQFVRARMVKAKDPVEVVLADVVDERNPYVPDRPMRRRVDGSERVETMPHFGVVEGTETSIAPRAYVISSAPAPTAPPATPAALRLVRPPLQRAARARQAWAPPDRAAAAAWAGPSGGRWATRPRG